MPDLSTTYLGLALKNPVIVGSSGITASLDGLKTAAGGGAAAVVLKSIFEEEIAADYEEVLTAAKAKGMSLESYDYYDYEVRGNRVASAVELVRQAKAALKIPVIASVNCTYSHEWASFAKELEQAGADALELNMFFLPSDLKRSSEEREREYFRIVERVLSQIRIPVALKISPYFSTLAQMVERLSTHGRRRHRPLQPVLRIDFDIEKLKVTSTDMLSDPVELALAAALDRPHGATGRMRPGRLHGRKRRQVGDQAHPGGSQGRPGGLGAPEAGTRAYARQSAPRWSQWMGRHGYRTLSDFRGVMSQAASEDPAVYERVQYMKHFGG